MYDIDKLRFWCHKIIPLVYDDSLSYYEVLCKVAKKLNEVIESVDNIPEYIAELISDERLREIIQSILNNLQEQIASANEGKSETATADRIVGELVWLDGDLYRCIKEIDTGDRYVVDANVEKVTVEECINDLMKSITNKTESNQSVASIARDKGEIIWFNNKLYLITNDIAEGNAYTSGNCRAVTIEDLLNIESDARTEADTALGERIDDEEEARAQADTALGLRIDDEIVARENADSALDNKIENLKNQNGDVQFIFVKNTNNTDMYNGNCCIIKSPNHVAVCDLSYSINLSNIIDTLSEHEITHIDYIFISHYHADHASVANLTYLINNSYVDDNTVVYLPRRATDAPAWNSELETTYNDFISVLNTNNITYYFPSNGTTLTSGDVTYEFCNCSENDYLYYNSNTTDYNNYSMVVYVTHGDLSVCLNGDIYNIAQKRIYDTGYAKQCILSEIPHHGGSTANSDFFNVLRPTYGVVCACDKYYKSHNLTTYTTSVFTFLGAEIYGTNKNNVAFNSNGKYITLYTNQHSDSFNAYQMYYIYLDTTKQTDGNGSVDEPFNSFKSLMLFIQSLKYASVNVVGNNSDVDTDYIISELSNIRLSFNNINFKSLRVINCDCLFYGCTFESDSSYCLYLDNSTGYIDNNSSFTGGGTQPAITVTNSKLRGYANISNKTIGIRVNESSEILIFEATVSNVNYLVDNQCISSDFVCNKINGSLTSAIATNATTGNYGQNKNVITLDIFDSNVGTIDHQRGKQCKDKIIIDFLMASVTLSSQVTTIGTISDPKMRPLITTYIPVTCVDGGLTAGTLYQGMIIVNTNGNIQLVAHDYANINRIVGTLEYVV